MRTAYIWAEMVDVLRPFEGLRITYPTQQGDNISPLSFNKVDGQKNKLLATNDFDPIKCIAEIQADSELASEAMHTLLWVIANGMSEDWGLRLESRLSCLFFHMELLLGWKCGKDWLSSLSHSMASSLRMIC